MRLADDYQYESEEEKEQSSKNSDKKQPSKKLAKTDVRELNKLIFKETSINKKLFKRYFNFRMPTAMLKAVYSINYRKKMS